MSCRLVIMTKYQDFIQNRPPVKWGRKNWERNVKSVLFEHTHIQFLLFLCTCFFLKVRSVPVCSKTSALKFGIEWGRSQILWFYPEKSRMLIRTKNIKQKQKLCRTLHFFIAHWNGGILLVHSCIGSIPEEFKKQGVEDGNGGDRIVC